MKVTSTVHMVGGSSTHPGDCCIYLVESDGQLILVDAGTGLGHTKLCQNIAEAGYSVEDIDILVLTHGHIDHIGGAAALKEASGCEIIAHKEDRDAIEGYNTKKTAADSYGMEHIPVNVDRFVVDGSPILAGTDKMTTIHTPGHTPGSISVLYQPGGIEYTVLFGQDIHGPFHEEWGSDTDKWLDSMRKLLNVKIDVLCEGHYGVIQPREKVEDFIRGFLQDSTK